MFDYFEETQSYKNRCRFKNY